MRIWKTARPLLGAALLVAGVSLVTVDAFAQPAATPRPSSPPPPQQPPPQPPPVQKPERPPADPFGPAGRNLLLQHNKEEAEHTAQFDSALVSAERTLALARETSQQMEQLGTPQTFQNLGLRFEQLEMDLYLIVRHLRAQHEERDDTDYQRDVGPRRMLVTYDLLDGLERILKEAERLQGTLREAVLP